MLDKGDLAYEIKLHLQGIGKYIRALDVVHFLSTPDIKTRYGIAKPPSLSTAKRWMHQMGYRWRKTPSGLYIDGHEREDVVVYRQTVFLRKMAEIEQQLYTGSEPTAGLWLLLRCVWFHDESVAAAHVRRQLGWVHESENPVPRPKGEGPTLMVADFVSEAFGWLRSPDGKESARVLLKPGKNRDGYFANDGVLIQLSEAIDIVQRWFPMLDHDFVLNNARTHTKRDEHALSARSMPKGPTPSPHRLPPPPRPPR